MRHAVRHHTADGGLGPFVRETPGSTCTRNIWETCDVHLNDCPTCKNGQTCGMRADMTLHKYKLKSCRFYERDPSTTVQKVSAL